MGVGITKAELDAAFQRMSNAMSLFYSEHRLPQLHHLAQKEGEDRLSIYHVVRNADEGNWSWPGVTVVRGEFVLEVVKSDAAIWASRELTARAYTFNSHTDRSGRRRHTFSRAYAFPKRDGRRYTSPQYNTENDAILAAWVDYKGKKP